MHTAARRRHRVLAVSQSSPLVAPEGVQTRQCDLTDSETLERLVLDYFPDAVIHCAALSSPAAVDARPAEAEKINVQTPRRLAELCRHLGAKLVHVSTDMVFDGTEEDYRSTGMPNPVSLYGQMKLMAEKAVLKTGGDEATILRIPLVNGNSPGGRRSVHEQLFHRWMAGETVPLAKHEIRQPVSAENAADVLLELCERPTLHGLFHWSGDTVLSRFELGAAILAYFGLPPTLIREAATASGGGRWVLNRHPLEGKIKTRPDSLETQLATLQPPPACLEWYQQHREAAEQTTVRRRLVKGVDF